MDFRNLDELPSISAVDAWAMLKEKFPDVFEDVPQFAIKRRLQYYTWPRDYGSTAGPFRGLGGQAFSRFQVEAWAAGSYMMLFTNGKPFAFGVGEIHVTAIDESGALMQLREERQEAKP